MEEVVFLFLYHQLGPVTRRHYQMLQTLHPRDPIVPIGYRFKIPKQLPGTVDVALQDDHGWPIGQTWPEIDKIFLRWYLGSTGPRARRYVFFEYDILPRVAASQFYGTAWNVDVAAATIKTPVHHPEWYWWMQGPLLGAAYPHRCGVSPLAGTLWSNAALEKIARTPRLGSCHCELRMGTLARLLGFRPVEIPRAYRTISWQPGEIQVTSEATWFHPVKA